MGLNTCVSFKKVSEYGIQSPCCVLYTYIYLSGPPIQMDNVLLTRSVMVYLQILCEVCKKNMYIAVLYKLNSCNPFFILNYSNSCNPVCILNRSRDIRILPKLLCGWSDDMEYRLYVTTVHGIEHGTMKVYDILFQKSALKKVFCPLMQQSKPIEIRFFNSCTLSGTRLVVPSPASVAMIVEGLKHTPSVLDIITNVARNRSKPVH